MHGRVQELSNLGVEALPFTLTAAQKRVVSEILGDMARPLPMLRLLQGDVGSGKTAVALIASLAAVGSGYQVAILVPNEVLAAQHLRMIHSVSAALPEDKRLRSDLIAGKMTRKCASPSLLSSCTRLKRRRIGCYARHSGSTCAVRRRSGRPFLFQTTLHISAGSATDCM